MKLSIEALRKLIRGRLRQTHEQEVDPNSWMVPYVNLMTILMIFFLILYAFTNLNKTMYEKTILDIKVDVVSEEEQARKITELEKIKKIEHFVWDNDYQEFVEIEFSMQRIIIKLKEPILFAKGDAKLKREAGQALAEISEFIKFLYQENKVRKVCVDGHTDDVPVVKGIYGSNWDLAAARAYSVVDHFIEKEDMDPHLFVVRSFAHNRPAAPNDSEDNRAKNRRIEISIDKWNPRTAIGMRTETKKVKIFSIKKVRE